MENTLASWSAIGASIATLIVAILTLFNVIIAKNTLKLMQSQENSLLPRLELYIIESFLKKDLTNKSKLYAINLRLTNQSDSNDTLKDLEFVISYHRDPLIKSEAVIPIMSLKTDLKLIRESTGIKDEILRTPIEINTHGVITGWSVFEVKDEILHGIELDSMKIRIIDSYNKETILNIIHIQER
jgi:hypothetical protein